VLRLDRGSAAVEFALVLPLALFMALALVQVALLGREAVVVTQAARDGAREAAVTTDEDRIRDAALRSGLDASRTDVAVERHGTVGDPVTVRVEHRASLLVPFLDWLLPRRVVLQASATMRQETQ
jgi:Flp pilus assembly protein TadG